MIDREQVGAELARAVRAGSTGASPLPKMPSTVPAFVWPGPGALRERRSHRAFTADELPESLLADVVGTALAADRVLWPQAAGPLDVTLLIPPGVAHLRDDRIVHTGESTPDTTELVAQQEFGAAPALLVVTADLVVALRAHGAHGYRELLTRAGAAANTCLLRAGELDIVGCLFDGLLPAARHRLDGIDGVRWIGLVAVVLGRARH